jgi:hypothetical protein
LFRDLGFGFRISVLKPRSVDGSIITDWNIPILWTQVKRGIKIGYLPSSVVFVKINLV